MKLRKLLASLPFCAVVGVLTAQSSDFVATKPTLDIVSKSVEKPMTGNNAVKSDGEKPSKKSKKSDKPTPAVKSPFRLVSNDVTIQNAKKLNGNEDDFSPIFFENGLLYCSNSRKVTKKEDKKDHDLNLKYAAFDSLGNFEKPTSFGHRTNSKTHEGPSCFNAKGDTMFLTRVTSKGGIVKLNKEGETTLKIYIKHRDTDGNFVGEEILPFESETSSYCHPTLAVDGRTLYFASNMPGGFGGMDLWKSRLLKDGTWSQPINLGARVNSAKNELFPFISEKGMLYFASNGQKNCKGGLDLYHVDIENRTSRAYPMGEPFNTEGDDFGLMFLPKSTKKGYFSSNRQGGSGGDDIYEFEFN